MLDCRSPTADQGQIVELPGSRPARRIRTCWTRVRVPSLRELQALSAALGREAELGLSRRHHISLKSDASESRAPIRRVRVSHHAQDAMRGEPAPPPPSSFTSSCRLAGRAWNQRPGSRCSNGSLITSVRASRCDAVQLLPVSAALLSTYRQPDHRGVDGGFRTPGIDHPSLPTNPDP